jgi:hypothetical protein
MRSEGQQASAGPIVKSATLDRHERISDSPALWGTAPSKEQDVTLC